MKVSTARRATWLALATCTAGWLFQGWPRSHADLVCCVALHASAGYFALTWALLTLEAGT